MGGSTVYMHTFNKNKDSIEADINGTFAGQDENIMTDNIVMRSMWSTWKDKMKWQMLFMMRLELNQWRGWSGRRKEYNISRRNTYSKGIAERSCYYDETLENSKKTIG